MGYFEWGRIARLNEFVTSRQLQELEEAARLLEEAGFQERARAMRAWVKKLAEALDTECSGIDPARDPHIRWYLRFVNRMSTLQAISLALFVLLLSLIVLGWLGVGPISIPGQGSSVALFSPL
mgnify:CR=1 FL=1